MGYREIWAAMVEDNRISNADRWALLVTAWNLYVEGKKTTTKALNLEHDTDNEILRHTPTVGGIDLGDPDQIEEEEAAADDSETFVGWAVLQRPVVGAVRAARFDALFCRWFRSIQSVYGKCTHHGVTRGLGPWGRKLGEFFKCGTARLGRRRSYLAGHAGKEGTRRCVGSRWESVCKDCFLVPMPRSAARVHSGSNPRTVHQSLPVLWRTHFGRRRPYQMLGTGRSDLSGESHTTVSWLHPTIGQPPFPPPAPPTLPPTSPTTASKTPCVAST